MLRWATKWAPLPLLAFLTACAPDDGPGTRSEMQRVQAHLAGVEAELRATPTRHLSSAQRRARQETIAWLAEYRRAGVFPHNHVRKGERTPVFVDPHGTPCAVGYLLLRSGEDALVEDIVRADNLVRVPELRGEPRVRAWLAARGITLDEAARIQPWYGDPPPEATFTEESGYAGTTVGLSIVTAAAASYALMTEPSSESWPWVESVNVLTAFGHLVMVVVGNDSDSEAPSWAKNVNAFGAVAGTFVAVDRLRRWTQSRAESGSVAVSPLVRHRGDGIDLGVTIIR
jgi:hypothetical protein